MTWEPTWSFPRSKEMTLLAVAGMKPDSPSGSIATTMSPFSMRLLFTDFEAGPPGIHAVTTMMTVIENKTASLRVSGRSCVFQCVTRPALGLPCLPARFGWTREIDRDSGTKPGTTIVTVVASVGSLSPTMRPTVLAGMSVWIPAASGRACFSRSFNSKEAAADAIASWNLGAYRDRPYFKLRTNRKN